MSWKYVVLWMQGQQTQTMRPVVGVSETQVAYSSEPGISGALRFDTAQEADEVTHLIRTLYGEGQVLATVQDPPAVGQWTQRKMDEWLPAWAYIKKYSEAAS